MSLTDHPYTHSDAQFQELWDLLVKSRAITQRPDNWHIGRLENWRYASWDNPDSWYQRNVRLWRDEAGELAAYVISESGKGDIHLQFMPQHEDALPAMLDWIEGTWAQGEPAQGDGAQGGEQISIYLFENRTELGEVLAAHGYVDQGQTGFTRTYDLSRPYPPVPLPKGCAVETLALNGEHAKHTETERLTFGSDYLDERWFYGKASAPSYSHELDFCVVSPERQHVAFCLAWIDQANHVAEIDPVGTHPDHRRRGFATAVISACLRELRARGVRLATIGSGGEPNPSNRLYESLGGVATRQENRWTKALG